MKHAYRHRPRLVGPLGLILLTMLAPMSIAEAATPPNIVLIMADDLGWKDLHCYGNPALDTPVLDRLAAEGVRLTNGYAAAPVCTPTRAAIMTGQSPARLQITNHAPGNGQGFHLPGSTLCEAEWQSFLPLSADTLAERLRGAGYATGFLGKWHLSHRVGRDERGGYEPRLRPEHQGFQLNVGGCQFGGPPSYFAPYKLPNLEPRSEMEYLPDRLAEEGIAFVREHQEKPFFLCWWNYSVHYPFQAPQELIEKYQQRASGNGTPQAGNENPVYSAMIEGMDRAIGRLLAELDRLGLADNTLVVFTSDNGPFAANVKPLRGEKGYLYEGGIRVPWIVRWPGVVRPGTEAADLVVSTDLFPTFLAAAGVESPRDQPIDGVNLLPMLRGDESLVERTLVFHYPNYAFHKQNRLGSALRQGSLKLIQFYDDRSIELYDLASDISETNDLAKAMPERAAALQEALQQSLAAMDARLPTRLADDQAHDDQ
ncbi:MAG: sulfatase [Pirellulales bacterium]|jgi:arylsulfatase A|nr:sulfatase [Pirellulales bacterium]